MVNENRTRQLKLSDVPNDSHKNVSRPKRPRHALLVPQKGIPVGPDFRVSADSYNVILSRRIKTKSGKEQWEAIGYFSTIGNCLIGLVRQTVRDTELASIQAVQDKIAHLEHEILKMAAGR